jgi:catechol 2,3-dioxygenase-like lactoylglutathione lyase family enzyme
MRIGVVEVSVHDQVKARAFYTAVLGFLVKDDTSHGDGARWLTVVSPEDTDGPQLLLAAMNEAAAAVQVARRETGAPAVSFTTEHSNRDYSELVGRGAVFMSAPEQMGSGAPTRRSRTAAATCSTSIRTDGARCGC